MIISKDKHFNKSAVISLRLISAIKLMLTYPIAVILLEEHQSPAH